MAVASRIVLVLESHMARAMVDPLHGGRLASLVVAGHELLVGPDADPMRWGSYPMVPFAGRIRQGAFSFAGRTFGLPVNLGDHAIHGYGYSSPWEVAGPGVLSWRFGPPWPFAGEAVQRFELDDEGLTMVMEVRAGEPQPLMAGWHPWFLRDIGVGTEVELTMPDALMYELDDHEIPTGELVVPPTGPWDNCFTALAGTPRLAWGDAVRLTLSSSADHWVVFDRPEHALCVEPQTGAPNAVNRDPLVVPAGQALTISFRMAWELAADAEVSGVTGRG